jgi:cell division septation protein DedD
MRSSIGGSLVAVALAAVVVVAALTSPATPPAGTTVVAEQQPPDPQEVSPTTAAVDHPENLDRLPLSLRASTSPDREDSALVDRALITGDVAMFLSADATVASVEYRLDGRTVRYEHDPPFDFAGTEADGSASLWGPGWLDVGAHLVEAIVTFVDGTTATVSATFGHCAPGQPASVPSTMAANCTREWMPSFR